MVWAKTRYLGCAYSRECGGICAYYPGYIPDEPPFEEGPVCSNCPEGSECELADTGLCAYSDGPIIVDDDDDDEPGVDPDDGTSVLIEVGPIDDADTIEVECEVTLSSGYSTTIPMHTGFVIGLITVLLVMFMGNLYCFCRFCVCNREKNKLCTRKTMEFEIWNEVPSKMEDNSDEDVIITDSDYM